MRRNKGQINFEFLAAAGLYLLAVGTIITAGSNILPQYQEETSRSGLNLEAKSLTDYMMTHPGRVNPIGPNWEDNVENIEAFGLADGFLEINRSKVEALSTVGDASTNKLNYTKFKNVTDVTSQYRFRFTWMPTVDTNRTYQKGNPPSSNPDIEEPTDLLYNNADDEVHYGNIELEGDEHYFLVTSHDGVYNTTYYADQSNPWDFTNSDPVGIREEIPSTNYKVEKFQNRANEPGNLMIISKQIKTFGASIESDTTTVKIDRFGEMDGEPLKVEVWTW